MKTGQASAFADITGLAEEHTAIILAYQRIFSSFIWTKRALEGLAIITIIAEVLLLGTQLTGDTNCLLTLASIAAFCLLLAIGYWRHELCSHPPELHHVAKLYWQFDLLPFDESHLLICNPLRTRAEVRWPTLDPRDLLREAQGLKDSSQSLDAEAELLQQLHQLAIYTRSKPYVSLKAGFLACDEPLYRTVIQSINQACPPSPEWHNFVSKRLCASQVSYLTRTRETLRSLAVFYKTADTYQATLQEIQETFSKQKQQATLHLCQPQSPLVTARPTWTEILERTETQYDVMAEIKRQVTAIFERVRATLGDEQELCDKLDEIRETKELEKSDRDREYNQLAIQEARQAEQEVRRYKITIDALKEEIQERGDRASRLWQQIQEARTQLDQLTSQPPSTYIVPSTVSAQQQVIFAAEIGYLVGATHTRDSELRKSIDNWATELEDERNRIDQLNRSIRRYKKLARRAECESRQRVAQIDQERQETLKDVEEGKQKIITRLQSHIERLKEVQTRYLTSVSERQEPLQVSEAIDHAMSQQVRLNQAIIELRQQAIETLFQECATRVAQLEAETREVIQWLAQHLVAKHDLPIAEAILIPVWVVTYVPWDSEDDMYVEIITPSHVSLAHRLLIWEWFTLSRVQVQEDNDAARPWFEQELIPFILNSPDLMEKSSCLQNRHLLHQLPTWITRRWQRAGWIHKSLAKLMTTDIERKLRTLSLSPKHQPMPIEHLVQDPLPET